MQQPAKIIEQRHQEIEIKFSCTAATLAEVVDAVQQASPVPKSAKHLQTVYYDTADLSLRRNGASLRLRVSDGDIPLLGFKAPCQPNVSNFHRYETEVPAPGRQLDLSLFDDNTSRTLRNLIGNLNLEPQFEVRVKRQLLRTIHQGAEIEIAADEGSVLAAVGTAQITELELELKSGSELALHEYAAGLIEKFPLSLSFVTKSDRGFYLSAKASANLPEPPALELTADMTLDDVIEATLSHSLHHFTSHWHAMRETQDPEAPHQLRIALRQLRTALSMFSKFNPCEDFGVLRKKAKSLASVLGQARSYDVLAGTLIKGSSNGGPMMKGQSALLAIAAKGQVTGHQAAREAINSSEASLFVLQAQRLIATRGWRPQVIEDEVQNGPTETKQIIRQILQNLYFRVLRKGRKFSKLSDHELHGLRLSVKALSFASRPFSTLTGSAANARQFDSVFSKLQKRLGLFNDTVFALQFCESDEVNHDPEARAAANVLHRSLMRSRARYLKKLKDDWKSFKTVKPHWA